MARGVKRAKDADDKNVKESTTLDPSTFVLVRKKKFKKFETQWLRPYRVAGRPSTVTYSLVDNKGKAKAN